MTETFLPTDSANFNVVAADEVLAAAAEIVDAEARRLEAAPEAGYLAVLATPAPETTEPIKASMFTNIHGSTDDE